MEPTAQGCGDPSWGCPAEYFVNCGVTLCCQQAVTLCCCLGLCLRLTCSRKGVFCRTQPFHGPKSSSPKRPEYSSAQHSPKASRPPTTCSISPSPFQPGWA